MRTLQLAATVGAIACIALLPSTATASPDGTTATPIQHLVVVMQSGHSFDNYFGTYPGASGIPKGACLPANTAAPAAHECISPHHITNTAALDLDHGIGTWRRQYDGGRMDGFVSAYRRLGLSGANAMGYYDRQDIPFYWSVADNYVLFDHFFSSARVGVRLNRFWWVAARPTPSGGEKIPQGGYGQIPTIFDRLEDAGVSWKVYVQDYEPHVTYRTAGATSLSSQVSRVPLVDFARFVDSPRLAGHIVDANAYYADLAHGTLPAVAFMTTSGASESPPGSPAAGESFVNHAVNALAMNRYWPTSAFIWTYDSWGGWYDNVRPPAGYGFRVPALLVSAYARIGYVDHTTMDYTAILKFIEQNWHLPALAVRDAQSPGLASAFDFAAPPRAAQLLSSSAGTKSPPDPKTGVVYGVYAGELALVVAMLGVAVRRRGGKGGGLVT